MDVFLPYLVRSSNLIGTVRWMTRRDRTGAEQEFTCWSSDKEPCRGRAGSPEDISSPFNLLSFKGLFFLAALNPGATDLASSARTAHIDSTIDPGKTANAFLSPPQSLVRGESVCSPSSPCTRSQSWQPLWFLRGMFSLLPNAVCSLQWGNQSLEAEELICHLATRMTDGDAHGNLEPYGRATGHRHPCGTPKDMGREFCVVWVQNIWNASRKMTGRCEDEELAWGFYSPWWRGWVGKWGWRREKEGLQWGDKPGSHSGMQELSLKKKNPYILQRDTCQV